MLPEISAKNSPRNSWWPYFYSDGKKVSNYIAGIIPIGPGRRYTLSIYSTTTPFNFEPFRDFVFLFVKLNFLPFAAYLPSVHYLRNGPALAFL